MGGVCSRDDEVDNQQGDAKPTVNANSNFNFDQKLPDGLKPAALPQFTTDSPAKKNLDTPIAASRIEEVHAAAQDFEVHAKVNQLHPAVSRRLDGMAKLTADSFPALKQKYITGHTSVQIVINKKTRATYQGNMQKGVPHGFGRLIMTDGSMIEGYFNEGNPEGYIRRIESPSATCYEGEFRGGLANGRGTQIDDKGIVTDCNLWVNGLPTGHVVMRNPQGQIVFEGTMNNGKKVGMCNWYDEKIKAKISGNFVDDLLEGKGVKAFDNGQVYEGEFKKGVETGNGSLTFVDGRKFIGSFANGKPRGPGELQTDRGTKVKVTMKEGQRV